MFISRNRQACKVLAFPKAKGTFHLNALPRYQAIPYTTSSVWQEEDSANLVKAFYHMLTQERRELQARWDKQQLELQQERRALDARLEQAQKELKDYAIQVAELKNQVLQTMDEKLWIENNFNVRGALERITYQAAKVEKIIINNGGIQSQLNALAKLPNFQEILFEEVINRGLVLKDVEACVQVLYQKVPKHAHSNTGVIELCNSYFTRNEMAALVSFFTLQNQWSNRLLWREV